MGIMDTNIEINIDKIDISKEKRINKWVMENVKKDIIYRDVIYNNHNKSGIRLKLRNVKVLEVNKRKGLIRIVLNSDGDKAIIENIEMKIRKLVCDKYEYISCLMNVDGKCILSLAKLDSMVGLLYGMEMDCEMVIKNIQIVDNKCTCGIILENGEIKGDVEIYGEILEDEYYV